MPYRRRLSVLVIVASAAIGLTACTPEEPSTEESTASPREQVHLYLLIGQSNMVGRAEITEEDQWTHPRIIAINREDLWGPARNPLPHTDTFSEGVGPGMTFARTMAEQDESVTIGLVPCAKGASSLDEWAKGGLLYETAVRRTLEARKRGVLKGILWHQGESEVSREQRAKTYLERLTNMFADLRTDLGEPDVPIVVGEIGRYLYDPKYPYAKTVNEALSQIPQRVPHTALTTAEGLTPKDDGVHLDTRSQRRMGKRSARRMLELQGQQSAQGACDGDESSLRADDAGGAPRAPYADRSGALCVLCRPVI